MAERWHRGPEIVSDRLTWPNRPLWNHETTETARYPAGTRVSAFIRPTLMHLRFRPDAAVLILIATRTTALATNSGRSAWFVGVLARMAEPIAALTFGLLPPRSR